jgi:hypothetical protein
MGENIGEQPGQGAGTRSGGDVETRAETQSQPPPVDRGRTRDGGNVQTRTAGNEQDETTATPAPQDTGRR